MFWYSILKGKHFALAVMSALGGEGLILQIDKQLMLMCLLFSFNTLVCPNTDNHLKNSGVVAQYTYWLESSHDVGKSQTSIIFPLG